MNTMEKGKIYYNNNKITGGVKYTNEYKNADEKSKLLPNSRNLDIQTSSSFSNFRVNSSQSRGTNKRYSKANKSMEKTSISSMSLRSIDFKNKLSRPSRRRNLNISTSTTNKTGFMETQLNPAVLREEIDEFDKEMTQIEQSYAKSIGVSNISSSNLDIAETADNKDDVDIAIKKLIQNNRNTQSKISQIIEYFEKTVKVLKNEESKPIDPTLRQKQIELNMLQMK